MTSNVIHFSLAYIALSFPLQVHQFSLSQSSTGSGAGGGLTGLLARNKTAEGMTAKEELINSKLVGKGMLGLVSSDVCGGLERREWLSLARSGELKSKSAHSCPPFCLQEGMLRKLGGLHEDFVETGICVESLPRWLAGWECDF